MTDFFARIQNIFQPVQNPPLRDADQEAAAGDAGSCLVAVALAIGVLMVVRK